MRGLILTTVAAMAVALGPSPCEAQIWVTRGPDGTMHFTNVPAHRSPTSRVYISSRDTAATAPTGAAAAPSQVIADPTTPSVPAQSAEMRAMYLSTARDPSRYSRYDAAIREAAGLYQLPEPLIRAVIKQESDFNPYSVSSSGALGLMQLLPSTAASMTVSDPFDPRQNILGGVRYLRVLANTFNGDLVLTLAAYNAGSGAVIRYGGVPPYEETQNYVRQVLRYYYQYRAQ